MPFIDLQEQALRAKALQQPYFQQIPNLADSLAGGLAEGFSEGMERSRLRAETEAAEQRKAALELEGKSVEKALSEGQLKYLGPGQENEELSPSQFLLKGQKFERGSFADKSGLTFDQRKELKKIDQETAMQKLQQSVPLAAEKARAVEGVRAEGKADTQLKELDMTQDLSRTIIQQASEIRDKLGPVQALKQKVGQAVGQGDPDVLRRKTLLLANVKDYISKVSGSAASDREVAMIQQFQPTDGDTFEQLMAKIQGLDDFVNTKRQSLIRSKSQGPRTSNPSPIQDPQQSNQMDAKMKRLQELRQKAGR